MKKSTKNRMSFSLQKAFLDFLTENQSLHITWMISGLFWNLVTAWDYHDFYNYGIDVEIHICTYVEYFIKLLTVHFDEKNYIVNESNVDIKTIFML